MRRRRRKQSRQFKFRFHPRLLLRIGFIFSVLALIATLGAVMYKSKAFKIKEQNIQSNVAISKSVKDYLVGESLFDIDGESISSTLLKEHPEYKGVMVRKRFPRRIIMEIDKREIFAQIKGKKFYPVDREGVIVNSGSTEKLEGFIPIELAHANQHFSRGYHISDSSLELAFRLIEQLSQNNMLNEFSVLLINVVNAQGSYFNIIESMNKATEQSSPGVIKVIVGQENIPQKISLLKNLIEKELHSKISLIKYIDLRHKKVYVGFRR